jgi:hypothetical protein
MPRTLLAVSEIPEYLVGNLVHWVRDAGRDGFRCDVAAGVPLSFWEEARQALDAVNRDAILLAEAEMPEQQLKAFDISYNFSYLKQTLQPVAGGWRAGEPNPRELGEAENGLAARLAADLWVGQSRSGSGHATVRREGGLRRQRFELYDGRDPVWSENWICMNLQWFLPLSGVAIMDFEYAEYSRPFPVSADRRLRVDEPSSIAGH